MSETLFLILMWPLPTCVILDQLPMQPSCNVSCCSSGNVFIPVTFAQVGLMKFPVLLVSSMVYALHLFTFVSIVVHWHISGANQGWLPLVDAFVASLLCIAYWNTCVPLGLSFSPFVWIAAGWISGWLSGFVWLIVIWCGVVLLRLYTPNIDTMHLPIFSLLLSYQINLWQPCCLHASLFFSHYASCTPYPIHLRAVHGYVFLSSISPPPCGCLMYHFVSILWPCLMHASTSCY